MKKNAAIIAAAGALLLVGIIVAIVAKSPDDATPEIAETTPELAPHQFAHGPLPWPDADARSVVIRNAHAGPELELSPDVSLVLSPQTEQMTLEWSKGTVGERIVFTGRGTWRGHDVEARWQFARGNPQAAFDITVADVKASELDEPWMMRWALPTGDFHHVDDEMRSSPWVGESKTLNGWTPTWLEWRGAQQVVSFQQGIYDQLRLDPAERGGATMTIVLASESTRPRLAECAPEATIDVAGRFVMTVGEATPVFPSRWWEGSEAVFAPVFEEPAHHPEALAAEGKPMDSADAARRVRTLALGHSDTRDPRHGNGGLLGTGLGATIALPGELTEDDASSLRDDFESTRLELASSVGPVRLTHGDCAAIADQYDGASVLVTGYASYDGAFLSSVSQPNLAAPTSPAVMTLPQLDGRRSSLTDQALGKLYVDRMIRERGGFFFSAPLVASRNPLVPAGKEGLLVPERNGHWTISEDIVHVLADLELRSETEAFHVGGIGEVVDHWHRARMAELWYAPDGIVAHHSGEKPLEGYTVVAQGALDPTGPFVGGRDIRDARQAAQTWAWGTLEPDTATTLRFGAEFQPPANVEWVVEQPSD